MDDKRDETAELTRQIAELRVEVARLNGHRFVRIQNSPFRLLLQRFAMGLMVGLGSVVGATFLVSVLVYLLSRIDFVPIIGEWAATIVADIQASHPTSELPIGQPADRPRTGPHPP
ncbi:MAG: hypothetical protein JKP97_01375 [Rhodobacteraceae bacterium]|jgi:hypothetical protein|nr:hypothetical protein [Paracoccaceae bacterium]